MPEHRVGFLCLRWIERSEGVARPSAMIDASTDESHAEIPTDMTWIEAPRVYGAPEPTR